MITINNEIEKILFSDIKSDWQVFIEQQQKLAYYPLLIENLSYDYQTKIIYPSLTNILRPLKSLAIKDIKVVIIGQDPYHNGLADGLAFSSSGQKIPASLRNIFKEIYDDVGIMNTSPNLAYWQQQGVFLINSILSVREGQAKSHAKIGWEYFVLNLIKHIDKNGPYIFVLWGRDAQRFEKYLENAIIIKGIHPSPLAGQGFFKQKYFSQINRILKQQNKAIIDWSTKDEI